MRRKRRTLLMIISDKVEEADIDSPIYTLYMNPTRPYSGRIFSFSSNRGKASLEGITIRDVRDCFIRGLLQASGNNGLHKLADHGKNSILNTGDIYAVPLDEVDPMAVFQNMACEIEKLIGGPEAGFDAVTKLLSTK